MPTTPYRGGRNGACGNGVAKDSGAESPCDYCPGKHYNVCKLLDADRQKDLFRTGTRQRWRRREYLFRAGTKVGAVFKLTSGIVAVSRSLSDGRRQILSFVMSGDLCGLQDVDGLHDFDGEAITDVETCSFNREGFNNFVSRNRDVADEYRRYLLGSLSLLGGHLGAVGQLTSTERVAYFIDEMITLATERHIQTHPLALPMRRVDIADYLGLRLETVSRAFTKLKKRNIIELNDEEVIVLDIERLGRLSNSR
jgi:CRP/FNR family transcriptional regulator